MTATKGSAPAATVLLVEDHGVMREGIGAVLDASAGFKLIGATDSGEAAVRLIEQLTPDLVLLDLRLPDVSGLEVLRRLAAASNPAKVIVMTSYDSDHTIRQAMALGAKGYVIKRAGVGPLLQALNAVAQGRTFLSEDAQAQLAEHLDSDTLSGREIQILKLAAQGLTNSQIGERTGISERTVKFHIKRVLTKLNATDRTHAVALALRRGILEL